MKNCSFENLKTQRGVSLATIARIFKSLKETESVEYRGIEEVWWGRKYERSSKSMKILVNATNLVVGGGVQVATSFVVEAVRRAEADIEWTFCVSRAVAENVRKILGNTADPPLEIFDRNPNNLREVSSRIRVKDICKKTQADLAFTIFGPYLGEFSCSHFSGCAQGWFTHPNSVATVVVRRNKGFFKIVKTALMRVLSFHFFKKSQYFWIELDIAREGLKRGVGKGDAHIWTIGNTCAQIFHEASKSEANFSEKEIRLLAMGNPYGHKNFEIIPEVLAELGKRNPERKFVFTLTAPESGKEWKNIKACAEALGVGDCVRTVGKVALADCPKLYVDNHIVFMPTLLETFSATYPEAMAMRRPIVTTDLDFAHDICKSAAVYYSPLDAKDAATKILQVVEDSALRERLLTEGGKVLAALPSPQEKYDQLVSCMRKIIEEEKRVER